MTEHKSVQPAKAKVAEGKAAADKTREAQESLAVSKPTPTQEENDIAKCGGYITEHEPDGSPPDPNQPPSQTKNMAATKPGAGYQTRATRPAEA
jgi:hypothetical protein